MRALTQLIELRGSEGEKFIDFILDAIRASSRARGFPTEEFREAGEAREGVGKGKGRAGRADQVEGRRWSHEYHQNSIPLTGFQFQNGQWSTTRESD